MQSTVLLPKSRSGEVDLSTIRNIDIVCASCGDEVRVRISDSTLRSVPLVCPECQSSFASEREWLIASLEAFGEAAKYAGLLRNLKLVIHTTS